jgi:hypothetical protein
MTVGNTLKGVGVDSQLVEIWIRDAQWRERESTQSTAKYGKESLRPDIDQRRSVPSRNAADNLTALYILLPYRRDAATSASIRLSPQHLASPPSPLITLRVR